MNKKQKKALEESIKHWERMRDDPDCGEEPLDGDCACCKLYYESDCIECPIFAFTDALYCNNTPYVKAYRYWRYRGPESKLFKRWAQKEVDFLNKVLEAG